MRQLLFRKSYYNGISELSPENQLEMYSAIMRYAFEGETVEVSKECKPLFSMIMESMNWDIAKYERKVRDN